MTNMTNKPNKTWINYLRLEAQPQKCRHWPLALLQIASFRLSTAFTHTHTYIYIYISASFSEMRFWPMRMSLSLSHYLELYRETLQKTPAAAPFSQMCWNTVQGPLTRIPPGNKQKQKTLCLVLWNSQWLSVLLRGLPEPLHLRGMEDIPTEPNEMRYDKKYRKRDKYTSSTAQGGGGSFRIGNL